MSKVAIFSDLHIHNYGQFNDDNNVRLSNCLKVLTDIAEFCDSYGIDTVLFSGDLYDTQKALLTVVVNETIDTFLSIAEKYPNLRFIAISGNHDHASKNLIDKPAITSQYHISKIIPNNYFLIDNEVIRDGDIAYYGIPYYEFPEHFSQALDRMVELRNSTNAKYHYLMIHQTPKGLENSMIPFDCNPKDDRFKLFDHVFCGHIHARQNLTENFTIVGSPIHRDFGDKGKTKGILVFNPENPDKNSVFVPLKGYPIFEEVFEDEVETVSESDNFLVVKPRLELAEATASASVENFSTSLNNEELMRNFWQEVDGKDNELLSTGLSFLNP